MHFKLNSKILYVDVVVVLLTHAPYMHTLMQLPALRFSKNKMHRFCSGPASKIVVLCNIYL